MDEFLFPDPVFVSTKSTKQLKETSDDSPILLANYQDLIDVNCQYQTLPCGSYPSQRSIQDYILSGFINLGKPFFLSHHLCIEYLQNIFCTPFIKTLRPESSGSSVVFCIGRTTRLTDKFIGNRYICAFMLNRNHVSQITVEKALNNLANKYSSECHLKLLTFDEATSYATFWVHCEDVARAITLSEDVLTLMNMEGTVFQPKIVHSDFTTVIKNAVSIRELVHAQSIYLNSEDQSYIRQVIQPLENLLGGHKRIVVKDTSVHNLCNEADITLRDVIKYEKNIEFGDEVVIMTTKGEAICLGIACLTSIHIIRCSEELSVNTLVAKQEILIMSRTSYLSPKRGKCNTEVKDINLPSTSQRIPESSTDQSESESESEESESDSTSGDSDSSSSTSEETFESLEIIDEYHTESEVLNQQSKNESIYGSTKSARTSDSFVVIDEYQTESDRERYQLDNNNEKKDQDINVSSTHQWLVEENKTESPLQTETVKEDDWESTPAEIAVRNEFVQGSNLELQPERVNSPETKELISKTKCDQSENQEIDTNVPIRFVLDENKEEQTQSQNGNMSKDNDCPLLRMLQRISESLTGYQAATENKPSKNEKLSRNSGFQLPEKSPTQIVYKDVLCENINRDNDSEIPRSIEITAAISDYQGEQRTGYEQTENGNMSKDSNEPTSEIIDVEVVDLTSSPNSENEDTSKISKFVEVNKPENNKSKDECTNDTNVLSNSVQASEIIEILSENTSELESEIEDMSDCNDNVPNTSDLKLESIEAELIDLIKFQASGSESTSEDCGSNVSSTYVNAYESTQIVEGLKTQFETESGQSEYESMSEDNETDGSSLFMQIPEHKKVFKEKESASKIQLENEDNDTNKFLPMFPTLNRTKTEETETDSERKESTSEDNDSNRSVQKFELDKLNKAESEIQKNKNVSKGFNVPKFYEQRATKNRTKSVRGSNGRRTYVRRLKKISPTVTEPSKINNISGFKVPRTYGSTPKKIQVKVTKVIKAPPRIETKNSDGIAPRTYGRTEVGRIGPSVNKNMCTSSGYNLRRICDRTPQKFKVEIVSVTKAPSGIESSETNMSKDSGYNLRKTCERTANKSEVEVVNRTNVESSESKDSSSGYNLRRTYERISVKNEEEVPIDIKNKNSVTNKLRTYERKKKMVADVENMEASSEIDSAESSDGGSNVRRTYELRAKKLKVEATNLTKPNKNISKDSR